MSKQQDKQILALNEHLIKLSFSTAMTNLLSLPALDLKIVLHLHRAMTAFDAYLQRLHKKE